MSDTEDREDADDGEDETPKAPERTWPAILKLRYPVAFGKGKVIEELTFRRGLIGDMKGLDKGSVDGTLLVASRMCGQPVAVIERLDGEDGVEMFAIVNDFLGKFRRTGRTG